MESFNKDLEVGEIHQRDKWQFELKSEFFPLSHRKNNVYIQEFYFFIPNSLQINEDNYPKAQFYKDVTNFIRYKTPEFKIRELYERENRKSPLTRLERYCEGERSSIDVVRVEDELKLLGNIIRSSLRERIREMIEMIESGDGSGKEQVILEDASRFCDELVLLRKRYHAVQSEFFEKERSEELLKHFHYIDEFISNSINFYLIGYLLRLRGSRLENREEVDSTVCRVLAQERIHREEVLKEPKILAEDSLSNEYILYRSGLLNKYVMDALLLSKVKSSVGKRFSNLIGSIAAGIAMLFFFVLFVKQGGVFLINSMPFIVLTVILYILKDRIKESLKTLSYRQFAKWFSDYKTDIFSPDLSVYLGKMREYVSFIREKDLPKDIVQIRNREFHQVLETFKRPEQVLYYKKKISLFRLEKPEDSRRSALNVIFRFNISQFLMKADNPTQRYVTLDPNSFGFFRANLPKVYHLNMILKKTFFDQEGRKVVELEKFRLILDKAGIKRVEHLPN